LRASVIKLSLYLNMHRNKKNHNFEKKNAKIPKEAAGETQTSFDFIL
jgi:hypothetical protein